MGAEAVGAQVQQILGNETPPLIVGLQPSALVDHLARVDSSLLLHTPVSIEELEHILNQVKIHFLPSSNGQSPLKTIAGGSVANTIRGLSAGFGVTCGIIGACGDDEQGQLFVHNMKFNDVNLSKFKLKKGSTAQCVCLVDAAGNRTMRPCLSSSVRLQADDLKGEHFRGSKWLVLRYEILNLEIIQTAVRIAKQEGSFVSLDLASFEMVRKFREPLLELLESGNVDLCFANEDEATEVVRGEEHTGPEAALDYLGKHCQWAVVTLGSNGCMAKHGKEIIRVSAIGEAQPSDATGAGDLFASGFLYGLLKGLSLEDCCKVGSCSGGSVIRSLGGDVTPENKLWMYKQMQIKGLPIPEPNI